MRTHTVLEVCLRMLSGIYSNLPFVYGKKREERIYLQKDSGRICKKPFLVTYGGMRN
jgi:hypothetical protein